MPANQLRSKMQIDADLGEAVPSQICQDIREHGLILERRHELLDPRGVNHRGVCQSRRIKPSRLIIPNPIGRGWQPRALKIGFDAQIQRLARLDCRRKVLARLDQHGSFQAGSLTAMMIA